MTGIHLKKGRENVKIVILGGNSSENKQWVEKFSSELKILSEDIVTIDYSHWGSVEKKTIDLERELDTLSGVLKDSNRYVIIGKSAGALLALKGIYDKRIFPMACIFFGTAIIWGRANDFHVDDWLEKFSIPTLFVQREMDPAISSKELSFLLERKHMRTYEISVLPGNTHTYDEYRKNTKLAKKFLGNDGEICYDFCMNANQFVTVSVFIKEKDNALVLKRSGSSKFLPGNWEQAGGKVEKGEHPYDAAIREVLEETGLKVRIEGPYYINFYSMQDGRDMVEIALIGNLSEHQEVRVSDEHQAFNWITEDELDKLQPLSEGMKGVIKRGFENSKK